jgi:hypothetical protein
MGTAAADVGAQVALILGAIVILCAAAALLTWLACKWRSRRPPHG